MKLVPRVAALAFAHKIHVVNFAREVVDHWDIPALALALFRIFEFIKSLQRPKEIVHRMQPAASRRRAMADLHRGAIRDVAYRFVIGNGLFDGMFQRFGIRLRSTRRLNEFPGLLRGCAQRDLPALTRFANSD